MATLKTFGPYLDLIGSTIVHWKITSAQAGRVILENDAQATQTMVITGNFTIGPAGDITAGSATSVNLYQGGYNGKPVFEATGLAMDATKLVETVVKATYDNQIYSAMFSGADTINGSNLADALQGFAGNDIINAGDGNDRIGASAGDDLIDGGPGFDAVIYKDVYSNFKLERTASGYKIADLKGDGGLDTIANVERAHFNDKTVALFGANSIDGQVFRLYQAALDRAPDLAGLDFWHMAMEDKGLKLTSIADAFIKSAEYKAMYGTNLSNHDLVAKYYEHILHRAPDAGGLEFWTSVLDQHKASNAEVLAAISDSAENVAASAQLIGNGLVFDAPVYTFA